MLGFNRKKYFKKFHLGKSLHQASLDSDYKKNLKYSIIISIILIILGFQFFPRITKLNKKNAKIALSLIEVVDIPNVKKFEPPPPPPPVKKIEPIKTVQVEKKTSKKSLKDEVKKSDLKLDIDTTKELLLSDSQFDDIANVNFKGRLFATNNFGSMDFEYNSTRSSLSNDNADLSLDLPQANISKVHKEKSLTNSLLPKKKPQQNVRSKRKTNSELDKMINLNKNQFLLRESESTIGTAEFKTWNRINAALDRLNKDRYGELPENVKRISNGLAVSFAYRNGGSHDIFWSKGGKVIIRVTGINSESLLDELRKAYDALLQLIYKIDSSAS